MNLNLIKQTLHIHDGEERPLSLLLVYAFFVGTTLASFFAASSGLFLSVHSASALPYVYIAAAIVSSLTGGIYNLFKKHLSFGRLLYVTQIFLFISVLAFWVGLQSMRAEWASFGVLAWFTVLTALIHVTFWGLATHLFDVRQGKRLFGLVGAGEMVASVISGLATPLFIELWGTIHLLLIAALGLVGGLIVLSIIIRTYTHQIQATTPIATEKTAGITELLQTPYVRRIFILYLLSVTVLYFLDYGFLDRSQIQFQNKDDLARFFGVFFGISQGLTLLLLTFATSRLLNRYGIRFGMRVRPVVLLIGALALVGVEFYSEATALLFYLAVSTKLCDLVLSRSFNDPSLLILYQPLPPDQKIATQFSVETMIRPIAGGIAGVILLGLTSFNAHPFLALNTTTSLFIIGWLLVGILVFRSYRDALSEALVRRRLEGTDLQDSNLVNILRRYLQSPHGGEVIYALDLLEKYDELNITTDLPDLLTHPLPEVRHNVLERIGHHAPLDLMPDVRRRVEMEKDPQVLSAALVALCQLGEADAIDDVAPYLDHENSEVQKGAIVGLLRSGGIDGILLAGRYLLALEQSTDPAQRIFIAQVLGEVGTRSFYQPLLKLLRDPDPDVRREAIIAAGKVKNPRLWSQVMQNLMTFSFHSTAMSAFVTTGDEALPVLATTFETPETPSESQIHIAQTLGRIKSPDAISILEKHINIPDGRVRTQILKSLHQCDYRTSNRNVVQHIRTEVKNITELLACLADLGANSAFDPIRRACIEEINHGRQRCFYLLSFVYDPTTILRAQQNLQYTASAQKAYALEVLHTLLTHELSTLILPLCESITPTQRLNQLEEHFPQQALNTQTRLRGIALNKDHWVLPWLRANALYHLTDTQDFVSVLYDADELVRETAIGKLYQTAPDIYAQYAASLKQNINTRIARTAQNLERWSKGGQSVLLTIEKVMVLKSVDIFANVSEDVLASLAAYLNEIDLPQNENVYEKGGLGDTLYIIVEGEVRIHDGEDNTLVMLGERDFFGELTTLDPQPHAATATATQDTRLLGLDRDTLYELMSDHPEMLKSIVSILCQRLRGKQR